MESILKIIAILLEMAIQLKRNDDEKSKQSRLQVAKSNPAEYLSQFGRVRYVTEPDEHETMRGD